MNKSAFVIILVLCCLALVNAVDFQNQQLTLILNGEYTKLFWKYDVDVVEIESHSNHRRNLGSIVSFYSDVELSTYVTMLDNEQFKFVGITVFCSRKIPNSYIGLQQEKNQGWSAPTLQPIIKSPHIGQMAGVLYDRVY